MNARRLESNMRPSSQRRSPAKARLLVAGGCTLRRYCAHFSENPSQANWGSWLWTFGLSFHPSPWAAYAMVPRGFGGHSAARDPGRFGTEIRKAAHLCVERRLNQVHVGFVA
jgi:hypothetical protein